MKLELSRTTGVTTVQCTCSAVLLLQMCTLYAYDMHVFGITVAITTTASHKNRFRFTLQMLSYGNIIQRI